jgi:hypothetical protein
MSRLIIALFGIVVAAIGISGLLRPGDLVKFVRRFWTTRHGVNIAAALRLFLGIALILAASGSSYPQTLAVLGYLSVAGALLIVLLGYSRIVAIIEWWSQRSEAVIRIWAFAALAYGVFLLAAIS